MLLFGPMMWLILLVFAATLLIQFWLQNVYARYSRVANSQGLTGAEVARAILDAHGLHNVRVEMMPGTLTDHYDPIKKVVRLSQTNYASSSVAALAVAAHEVGHALQDAQRYHWLVVRHQLLPAANIGSNLGPWLFIIGLFIGALGLAKLGLYLFAAAALFQLVTLPVEFDASRRALEILKRMNFLSPREMGGARTVLTAAALTYVAALAMSIAYLLQYASILSTAREE
ncbi:zinc metallopeptidase [Marinithermus hydrothermalis]|uniref:Peptidase membrane zinc metallopeptidase n=1 Tax=Marinithermus hydrothermalis (strain DSM 14884 / JCM 11576 / T1) TaxID=869210 RepID=F2NK54_MARHT|nr:zinc metallopeptidase [Marinithermus hydrothermalis]AEB12025.1 peptidase membrane zinc metallopeptidase [Marinithermus hydrothermalis DSM 14884]